jgi:hypothetical protein
MRNMFVFSLAFIFAVTAAFAADDPFAEIEARSLFNGKDLSGWECDDDWFRVEDGAIVGGSMEKIIPHNYFLCTEDTYGDFELRLLVKLEGDNANGGVQFRSVRVPDSTEVSGYQADMGQHYWGCLYDESRRNRIIAQVDEAAIKRALKPADWNEYVIRAVGKHIELFINGEKTVDYTEQDEDIAETGHICLQIHSGTPAQALYRDITIKSLDPK